MRTIKAAKVRGRLCCALMTAALSQYAPCVHADSTPPERPLENKATPQLSRLDQIGPAILGCWRPPAGAEGSQATVMFSLNRSGAVIGKPKLTFVKLVGDAGTQQRFAASVTQAMASCTPLALNPGLGAAIAGEVFTLRFILENRGA